MAKVQFVRQKENVSGQVVEFDYKIASTFKIEYYRDNKLVHVHRFKITIGQWIDFFIREIGRLFGKEEDTVSKLIEEDQRREEKENGEGNEGTEAAGRR